MASKKLVSTTIFLIHISLIFPPSTLAQCPYPCNPPPITGGGNIPIPPPAITLPPPSQTGNYPPPTYVYPPPSNVFPYNPPTPTFYGGAPPPPDPIVPWFPFYYKDPPRNPSKSSSANVLSGSTAVVVAVLIHLLVFQLVLC